jgi:acyl-CoA dehydrogenase
LTTRIPTGSGNTNGTTLKNAGIPADQLFLAQLARQKPDRWTGHPPILDTLKKRARSLGLWNLFLPIAHFPDISPGFSNVEYGLMAEQLGKSLIAPEVCNCNAPDTGNMEVLAKYGNEEQKRVWLRRLLEGEIRSAFLMTEPEVASSDATNIELSIKSEGDEWVLNGSVSLLFRFPLPLPTILQSQEMAR